MSRWPLFAGLLVVSACALPPKDPFLAAERALRRNDLLQALEAYDAVPVMHARYPDARAAASEVEQRMRRCHELILEALLLRSQWRDSEALKALNRAADHWPAQPGIRLWIAATEKRLRLFGDRVEVASKDDPAADPPLIEVSRGSPESQPKVVTAAPGRAIEDQRTDRSGPVPVPSERPLPMAPKSPSPPLDRSLGSAVGADTGSAAGSADQVPPAPVEVADAPPPAAPLAPTTPRPSGPPAAREDSAKTGTEVRLPKTARSPKTARPPSKSVAGPKPTNPGRSAEQTVAPSGAPSPTSPESGLVPRDPVALGLVAVEASLGRGDLTSAVRDLLELSRRFPSDARIKHRLSRLLHQRALMHYGSGAVAAAVVDWRRVLEIDPDNAKARRMLDRAVAESQPRSRGH